MAVTPTFSKPLLAVGCTAIALFALVTVFGVTGWSRGVDDAVIAFWQSVEAGWLTSVFKASSLSGEVYWYFAVSVILLVVPRSRARYGLPLFLATSVSGVANIVAKALFRVARPDTHRLIAESGFSYPSAHAMVGAAFAFMLALLLIRHLASRAASVALACLLGLDAVVIGISRVYLGVHWPVDVLGGYLAGVACSVVVILVLDQWAPMVGLAVRGRFPKAAALIGAA